MNGIFISHFIGIKKKSFTKFSKIATKSSSKLSCPFSSPAPHAVLEDQPALLSPSQELPGQEPGGRESAALQDASCMWFSFGTAETQQCYCPGSK